MAFSDALIEIRDQVRKGERPAATVRTLLSWFDAHRRSWRNVQRIREVLGGLGVTTVPDFEGQYIDHEIYFVPKDAPPPAEAKVSEPAVEGELGRLPDVIENGHALKNEVCLADASHRISRLASANKKPVRVSPNTTVEQAVTLMLQNEFSQLPVMTTDREVKGMFSWRSLGSRLALRQSCVVVQDAMDRHESISANASLFDAVRIIAEHDSVLVRDVSKAVCGIVTASDISQQFQQLAEPFLILGDIENHIRYMISAKFSVGDLQVVKDPADQQRKIEDVSDLTFGEYVRLLQNENHWSRLGMRIDRQTFTEELDRVREIRNDVMHFDPDPMDVADIRRLKKFASFLARLQQVAFS